MKSKSLLLLVLTAIIALGSSTAFAISPFKKAFDEKYVKESGNEEFQAAFRKAGCYNCHVREKKKDFVNAFGWELSQLIEGNAKDRTDAAREDGSDAKKAEEEKLVKELVAALEKVEAMKAPSGETYGELFKAHVLPTADEGKSIR
jgi:hypothetical protein